MPGVRLRIDGSTDPASRLRLKRELDRAGSAGSAPSSGGLGSAVSGKALLVVMAVAGVVYLNSNDRKPAFLLDEKPFRGERVVVVRDVSVSMIDFKDRLESRIRELRAGGVGIDLVADLGGSSVDLLVDSLGQMLPNLPHVDTVYFFADFKDTGSPERYHQLRRLLDSRELRLYIATVNLEPAREWVEIARESGGDVMISRR